MPLQTDPSALNKHSFPDVTKGTDGPGPTPSAYRPSSAICDKLEKDGLSCQQSPLS